MLLQLGDKIYTTDGRSKLTITRVTPKRAYIRVNDNYEIEFDRDIPSDRSFSKRGASGYHIIHYSVETPELVTKHKRLLNEYRFSQISVNELSDNQLTNILNIMNNGEGVIA